MARAGGFALAAAALFLAQGALAAAPAKPSREVFAQSVCRAAEARATENGLDPHFLVRLLWKRACSIRTR